MRITTVGVLCVVVTGCTQTDVDRIRNLECRAPVEQTLTPVVVSGPFAVARSFEVGSEGIPITDVVDQSLRPGYRAYVFGAQPTVQQTAAETSVPTVEVPARLRENVESWAREEIPDDADAARTLVKVQLKNTLDVVGNEADAKFAQLKQDFGQLPPDVPQTRAKVDEFWQSFKKVFNLREEGDPVANPSPVRPLAQTAAQTTMSSARVVINRASGTRLIIPVQTVMYTSAGDIRVLPGESVVMTREGSLPPAMHQARSDRTKHAMVVYSTASGRPAAMDVGGQDSPRTLASVYDKANSAMVGREDCVRVSRIAADGVAETYILPVLDMARQTKSAPLQNFNIADGDMIRFDLLDRTPDVLRSRELMSRIDSEEVKTLHREVEGRLSTLTGGRSNVVAKAKRRLTRNVGRFGRRVQSLVPQL